jgi:actin-related protein 6
MIPEMLFHPSDAGVHEAGIAETIADSIDSVPEGKFMRCYLIQACYLLKQLFSRFSDCRELLLRNIILIGGNCSIPGFKERFERDLRPFIDSDYEIKCFLPENPSTFAAEVGSQLSSHEVREFAVTREEFHRIGSKIWHKKGLSQSIPNDLFPADDFRDITPARSRKKGRNVAESSEASDSESISE